jgi:CspA family cold shock protein
LTAVLPDRDAPGLRVSRGRRPAPAATGASTRIPSKEGLIMTTQTGTVKWFNETKGFGFIAPDDGGKDLFAHFKEIQGTGFKVLAENQRVEFDVGQGQKGPQAMRIRAL